MALPRALPSAYVFPDIATTESHVPPHFVNSAVYIIGLRDDGTNTKLAIWKSSDPDASAFTIQDTSNEPTLDASYTSFDDSVFAVSSWVDGNIIHIAVAAEMSGTEDNALSYFRFDTSADTWSTTHDAWGTVLSVYGGDDPPRNPYCDIRIHTVSSDEFIQIGYAAAVDSVHGTDRDRVHIATFDTSGTTWTVGRVFDDSGTTSTVDYFLACLVKAAGVERIHGLVLKFGVAWHLQTISTTDGISLENDTITNTIQGWANGVSYDDGGTVKCRIALRFNTSSQGLLVLFDDAASVSTLSTDVRISQTPSVVKGHGFAVDGTDEYWFYIDSAVDLWYDLNDAADIELVDAKSFGLLHVAPESYVIAGRTVSGIKGQPCRVRIYNDSRKFLYIGKHGRGYLFEAN